MVNHINGTEHSSTKAKTILSVMSLALLLTGCGGEEKTTTICKGNIDEMTAAEVTIEATGDKTDVMKSTVTYDFTGYVTESTPIDTYWLPKVKSINVDYDSLKGGSAKYTVDGEKIILKIELDYGEADFDELKKLVKKNKKKGQEAFLFLLETNIFRNITNSITYVYFGRKIAGKVSYL